MKELGKVGVWEELEDEVIRRSEAKKRARLRTRGPYRRALLR